MIATTDCHILIEGTNAALFAHPEKGMAQIFREIADQIESCDGELLAPVMEADGNQMGLIVYQGPAIERES